MDNNGDKHLDKYEFEWGMRESGHALSPLDMERLFKFFDKNRDGRVSYDEFLRALRGDLNERRAGLVRLAYAKLDRNGDQTVNIEDMRIAYDTSFHPDVKAGRKTPDQVLQEFMSQWDTIKADGIVSLEEFMDYYSDVSASVDRDDEFELMIRNAWHIAGGEGWCENTTIPRHLEVGPDGK
jgi:Ca2+-binding EF-hand superfamily protein